MYACSKGLWVAAVRLGPVYFSGAIESMLFDPITFQEGILQQVRSRTLSFDVRICAPGQVETASDVVPSRDLAIVCWILSALQTLH